MQADLATFFWLVQPGAYSAGGVEATNDSTPDEPPTHTRSVFASMRQAAHPSPLRRYAPLREHTGLFRLFAETELTTKSVIGFADRFGLLLSARQTLRERPRPRGPFSGQVLVPVLEYHDEPLELWYAEAATLRKAVEVWETLETGDSARLAPHVRWNNDAAGPCSVDFVACPGASLFKPPPADLVFNQRVAARDDGEGWFERLTPGDAVLPARLWLTRLIDQKLEDRLAAHFVLSDAGKMSLAALPQNLLQAIWLQFGQAVCDRKQYKRCQRCRDWFELSPQVARTNRRFCGVACKNRVYRERREQARRLFAKGKKPKEIAHELGATPAAVRRWINANG